MKLFFPSLISKNVPNIRMGNTLDLGNLSLIKSFFRKTLYFFNVFPRQFSIWVIFTSKFIFFNMSFVSTFFNHILVIIIKRSKKKVVWIYAGRIVAFMKNAKSFWNLAIVNYPRSSMCLKKFYVFLSRRNLAITFRLFTAKPNPTSFSFFNFLKESYA